MSTSGSPACPSAVETKPPAPAPALPRASAAAPAPGTIENAKSWSPAIARPGTTTTATPGPAP
ncbi:hypothetical protein [Actinoplanes sp. NPDC049599]|uniref:hypothetical protein n=1 Tax=Actinoplanes sp. NPDC049599 TaxID=3363903 RepID=UPI0037934DE6